MVLKLRQEPPNWEKAKCKDIPLTKEYDPFFDEEDNVPAIEFCNGTADGVICPIRHECLIFALTNNCKEGVWGGTSETTRKAMRKKYPPLKGNVERDEWQWMSEQDALKGLSRRGQKRQPVKE